MNYKRFIGASIASSIAMWFFAGLWHILIMPKFYEAGHNAHNEGTGIILIAYIVLGFLMTFLYLKTNIKGRPISIGFKIGLLVGILWVFPHELAMAGAHDESITYVFKNASWHIIEQGLGGVVLGLIYGNPSILMSNSNTLNSEKVRNIYSGNVAKYYDLPISHMFKKYKKQAFLDSSLKKGDNVLVFCCGTGLDFSHIIERIGSEGKIVGVDFSSAMLRKAKERIIKNKWNNIELIEADVITYKKSNQVLFDVGICTLGLSIIPGYIGAYNNLISNIKQNGEIIIGDMQLASGIYSFFNPFTIFLAKRFGGTLYGHQNSLEICSIMGKELKNFRKKDFFLRSYYYCIGSK